MDERDNEARRKVAGFLRDIETQSNTSLALDEKGICTMEFEQGLRVILAVPEGTKFFSLQAVLIEAPRDVSLPLMTEALRLNLRFSETRGGSIGWYDIEEVLVFRYWHPIESCDGLLFGNILANFILAAYQLNNRLLQVAEDMLGTKAAFPFMEKHLQADDVRR